MPISNDDLKESLLFYRRQLTRALAVAMVKTCTTGNAQIALTAEDLANALTERLEARETGEVNGYNLKVDK